MPSSDPRVVVTGASGFIGRAVCRELVHRGIAVRGIGRSADLGVPGVAYQRVRDYAEVAAAGAERCVHLAGDSVPAHAAAHPDEAADDVVRLVSRMMEAGFARVVFASSSLVYGDQSAQPHREEEPLHPAQPYARAKAAAEQAIAAGGTIARIANVYGPGMSEENVVSAIVRQLPDGGPIVLRDLRPVRDYIHVDDVARALVDLALADVRGAFNVGTGRSVSVEELAGLLTRLAGRPEAAIRASAPATPVSTIRLDIRKLMHATGWTARIELADGLRALLASVVGSCTTHR